MAQPKPWTFVQIGGDRKNLQLTGWSAPFGRPRHGAIVNAGVKLRQSTTYYPGRVEPTVHVFGTAQKPLEMHGRWMDQAMGIVNGAQLAARAWKDFVEDGQIVLASWGKILQYRIVIEDLDIEWESEAECAWTLKCVSLADQSESITPSIPAALHPFDMANAMKGELTTATAVASTPSLSSVLGMLSEISDEIDSIISIINTPFAIVYQIASALSDFTSALSTDLTKLTGGLQEVKTGLLGLFDATDLLSARANAMQDQFASATTLGAQPIFSAADLSNLQGTKTSSDLAILNFLALMADMLNAIDGVMRGKATTAVVAQLGDTWEAIALRTMGGVDGARAIKDMNGIRGGAQPIAGKKYTIPSSA